MLRMVIVVKRQSLEGLGGLIAHKYRFRREAGCYLGTPLGRLPERGIGY
jgi:hypothetical protein